jgi:hypothetical protein
LINVIRKERFRRFGFFPTRGEDLLERLFTVQGVVGRDYPVMELDDEPSFIQRSREA